MRRTARIIAVLAVLRGLAAGAEPAAPPEGRVVDRVVAVVEGTVLTLSELELETRVLLVDRGGLEAESAALGDETLREALELVVSQRLQVLDADRLQAFPVEASEVAERVASLQEKFGGEAALQAFLARHDADLDQLAQILIRGLRAQRFLDSRIRLRAQVAESEVRRYYDAHAGELSGSYAALRPMLQQKLAREKYARLAAEELSQVRRVAQVRMVAPFAREIRP